MASREPQSKEPVFAGLPNRWTWQCSGSQTIDLDSQQVELGWPSDQPVLAHPELAYNRVYIIEAVIIWLRQ